MSPIDAGNMNRAYPGDAAGTPTFAIAHFVETMLLPHCDFALDLHSGGKASEFLPCAFLVRAGEPEFLARKVASAEAFGAPTTCVVAGTADQRSLSAAADRHQVVNIATELAGGGTISQEAVRIGLDGTRRWLAHTGVLPTSVAAEATRFLRVRGRNDFVMATIDGVFEPNAKLGDQVSQGDVAGWLHPTATTTAASVELKFAADGVVMRLVPARTMRGDYLFHLGAPTDAGLLMQESGDCPSGVTAHLANDPVLKIPHVRLPGGGELDVVSNRRITRALLQFHTVMVLWPDAAPIRIPSCRSQPTIQNLVNVRAVAWLRRARRKIPGHARQRLSGRFR